LAGVARELNRRLLQRLAEARRPVTAFRGGWLGHRYDQEGGCIPTRFKTSRPTIEAIPGHILELAICMVKAGQRPES
jgi:hypothetical protein